MRGECGKERRREKKGEEKEETKNWCEPRFHKHFKKQKTKKRRNTKTEGEMS
jgi:hypothetical protein